MFLLIFLFLLAILSTTPDPYDFVFNRKRGKKLPRNEEYAESVARYVKGGKLHEGRTD